MVVSSFFCSLQSEALTQVHQQHRKFIQRLFPEVQLADGLPDDQWFSNAEKAVKAFVNTLSQKGPSDGSDDQVKKLLKQVDTYRMVFDDMESSLQKLQSQVQEEELKWRAEVESLKEKHALEVCSFSVT